MSEKTIFDKTREFATSVAGHAKVVAGAVAEQVGDQIDTLKGGKIRVHVSVIGERVVLDPGSDKYIDIDPADYDRV